MAQSKGPVPGGAEKRRARLEARAPEQIALSRVQLRNARKRGSDAAAARWLADYDAESARIEAAGEPVAHDCGLDGHRFVDDGTGILTCEACPVLWVETLAIDPENAQAPPERALLDTLDSADGEHGTDDGTDTD